MDPYERDASTAALTGIAVDGPAPTIAAVVDLIARIRSARHTTSRSLDAQPHHDPVTGLADLSLFVDRLDAALRSAKRAGTSVSVLRVLIRHSVVEPQVQHALLRQVADRLAHESRAVDSIARVAELEFAVIAPEVGRTGARDLADRAEAILHRPFLVLGRWLDVASAIGVAVSSEEGNDAATLMRAATPPTAAPLR